MGLMFFLIADCWPENLVSEKTILKPHFHYLSMAVALAMPVNGRRRDFIANYERSYRKQNAMKTEDASCTAMYSHV